MADENTQATPGQAPEKTLEPTSEPTPQQSLEARSAAALPQQPPSEQWITLDRHPDYEISLETSSLRKKDVLNPIKLNRKDGYQPVILDGRFVYFHRLVAEQFVPNPDPVNLTKIDHIDHDRTNNSVENLRWVSSSINNRNKKHYGLVAYSFLESLPENATRIESYRGMKLDWDYYLADGNVYVSNLINYKQLPVHEGRFVNVRASNKQYIKLYLRDFQN
jgi:hypothetical protein